MEGNTKTRAQITSASPQHVKDGVIDLVAGSLGKHIEFPDFYKYKCAFFFSWNSYSICRTTIGYNKS